MKKEEGNTSGFEFKPEYWKEAEALIEQEEKRRRAGFYFKTAGIAALLFLVAGSALYFSGEEQNEQASVVMKSKENVEKTTTIKNVEEEIKYENRIVVEDKKSVKKSVVVKKVAPEVKGDRSLKDRNFVSPLNIKSQDDSRFSEKIISQEVISENLSEKTKIFNLISTAFKNIKNEKSVIAGVVKSENNFQFKAPVSNMEVYASVMLHPNYGYGLAERVWLLSGNAGFSVSKNISPKLSYAIGAQYNYYRGLYNDDRQSKYTSTNIDTVVQYNTTVNNENWELLSDSNYSGPTYVVSSPDNLWATKDTITFDKTTYTSQNTVEGRYTRREKNVLSGSVYVPFELKYQHKRVKWVVGMGIEYLLYNKVSVYESTEYYGWNTNQKSTVQKNDFNGLTRLWFNALVGVDYRLNKSFSVGARAVIGLNDITNNTYFLNNEIDRNLNFSVSARYHLNSLFY